jgi:4-amino-4-deoxy-L-arabinose transferase-like glycosyltransferase
VHMFLHSLHQFSLDAVFLLIFLATLLSICIMYGLGYIHASSSEAIWAVSRYLNLYCNL